MFNENMKTECPYYENNICETKICACAKFLAFQKVKEPGIVEQKISELGINLNQDSLSLMMDIQKCFSKKFRSVENISKEDKDKWINQYLICMEDEISELREYLDIYPNEKSKPFNVIEVKKELIDILHFVMDVFISGEASSKDIEKYYLEKYSPEVSSVKDFMKYSFDTQTQIIALNYNKLDTTSIILILSCKLLDNSAAIRKLISWKHWKKSNPIIDKNALFFAFADLYKAMIDLFLVLMDVSEIKQIYIEKNVENILRQENNY